MSARVSEPGMWGKFQSAAGENLQNRVRAREIRTNKVVNKEARPTPATRRLVLVIAKKYRLCFLYLYRLLHRCKNSKLLRIADFNEDNQIDIAIATGFSYGRVVVLSASSDTTGNDLNNGTEPSNGVNTCQSADSDHDNDGWGWENNASCRVATEDSATQPNPMPQGSTIPACQSLSADPDGDGWGWENSATCRVVPEDSTTQPNPMPQGSTILACQSQSADPDGDGWGWENSATCRVATDAPATTTGHPLCASATSDSDSDGWGWEQGRTCIVSS